MEPSCRWEARHTFGAFDVPVQGSCAFQVHYTIRGTDSLDSQPEQSRISLEVGLDGASGELLERFCSTEIAPGDSRPKLREEL